MKIAFDENIPIQMVKVFQTLASDEGVLNAKIVQAKKYRPADERGDEHWVRRFASDHGQVVISGGTKMRSRIHERAALAQCGLVTYCFERHWSVTSFFTKSAMLLQWWPKVREHMDGAPKGSCWEIPFVWNWKDLVDVSANPKEITPTKPDKG